MVASASSPSMTDLLLLHASLASRRPHQPMLGATRVRRANDTPDDNPDDVCRPAEAPAAWKVPATTRRHPPNVTRAGHLAPGQPAGGLRESSADSPPPAARQVPRCA